MVHIAIIRLPEDYYSCWEQEPFTPLDAVLVSGSDLLNQWRATQESIAGLSRPREISWIAITQESKTLSCDIIICVPSDLKV